VYSYEAFRMAVDAVEKSVYPVFVVVMCFFVRKGCLGLCDLWQVILDLVAYKELTVCRLIDDKFSQPGIGVVLRLNDSPKLKPLSV